MISARSFREIFGKLLNKCQALNFSSHSTFPQNQRGGDKEVPGEYLFLQASIPEKLFKLLKIRIKDTAFNSVSSFATYKLRQMLIEDAKSENREETKKKSKGKEKKKKGNLTIMASTLLEMKSIYK